MLDYQDALLDGQVVKGERDCLERWELIKPHVPSRGLVLDVGSNLGYFGIQIVTNFKDAAVVSIESDQAIIARQGKILRSRRIDRIVAIQGRINSVLTKEWVQTCDWFELTLLLSIVHWFDEPGAVVERISQMSGKLIVELPDVRDKGACGQANLKVWGSNPLEWLQEVTHRQCTHIGYASRHTSGQPAHLLLIDGPVSRVPSIPYWDHTDAHPEGNRYRLEFDGSKLKFTIRDRLVDYLPGINLVSLMKLGRLVWPRPKQLLKQGIAAIRAVPDHNDPTPHNLLWTPTGLKLIDVDDLDWGHNHRVAIGSLKKQIRAWRHNRLAAKGAYLPALPLWRKITWLWPRVLAEYMLPKQVFRFLQDRYRRR